MTEDLHKIVSDALEGKRIIESGPYLAATERMTAHLEAQLLSCNPDDKEKTQRVVLAKQIFKGIQREFARLIQDGEVAQIQLDELNNEKVREFRR